MRTLYPLHRRTIFQKKAWIYHLNLFSQLLNDRPPLPLCGYLHLANRHKLCYFHRHQICHMKPLQKSCPKTFLVSTKLCFHRQQEIYCGLRLRTFHLARTLYPISQRKTKRSSHCCHRLSLDISNQTVMTWQTLRLRPAMQSMRVPDLCSTGYLDRFSLSGRLIPWIS
jgi:hypothetical protein